MHNVCHRRPMRVSLCDPGPDGCAEMHAVGSGNWEGLRGRVAVSGVYIHARVTCHPYCLLLCDPFVPLITCMSESLNWGTVEPTLLVTCEVNQFIGTGKAESNFSNLNLVINCSS